MRRIELTLAVAVCVVLLGASALMGIEKVAPGQSFASELGLADPQMLAQVHRMLGLLFAALVAAAIAAVAARDDGPSPALVRVLSAAVICGAAVFGAAVLAPDLLEGPLSFLDQAGLVADRLEVLLGALVVTTILVGAACLTGARQGYGWLGFFGQAATMAIFAIVVSEALTQDTVASAFLFLVPVLTLLALLAAQLADEDVPAAPYLFAMMLFGLVVMGAAGLSPAMASEPALMDPSIEGWVNFLAFVVPFFGLFAALNRARPGQHGGWIWVHALGLIVLAIPSMGPMTGSADLAPGATLWGFVFYGWVLLGLTVTVRRSVRRSIAHA